MIENIHICTAVDGNYKLPLKCLANSIFKNTCAHPCVLHVLFTNLSENYRRKLINKYKETNLSFDFIDMSKYEFDSNNIDMRYWTKAIFYRIMIPEIFKDLDRILYLDGDTLVLKDLYELFNIELPERANMAMVVDKFSWREQMQRLHISNYFNSGVILFDIKKCLRNNFSQKCIKWINENKENIVFPDQDAINAVSDNKILRINNTYNKQLTLDNYHEFDGDAHIAHFLSGIKPWMWKYPRNIDNLYVSFMPSILSRIITHIKHDLSQLKHFCFHIKYKAPLINGKIVAQYKYYIFNVCVFTQNKNSIDFKQAVKIKKDLQKC